MINKKFFQNGILRIWTHPLFYKFIENKSIKDRYLNCKELSKQLKIENVIKKIISKFLNNIRIKINNEIHKN